MRWLLHLFQERVVHPDVNWRYFTVYFVQLAMFSNTLWHRIDFKSKLLLLRYRRSLQNRCRKTNWLQTVYDVVDKTWILCCYWESTIFQWGQLKTEMYRPTGKLDFKMFPALRQSIIHLNVYNKTDKKLRVLVHAVSAMLVSLRGPSLLWSPVIYITKDV